MFISIAKTGNERYVFAVGDEPTDESGSFVHSYFDSAILGNTPTTFSSFGEAHSVASRLIDENPDCVLAKKAAFYTLANGFNQQKEMAEGKTVAHYIELSEIIGQRIAVFEKLDLGGPMDELIVIENEVNTIKKEIPNLIELSDGNGRETFISLGKRFDNFSDHIEQLKSRFQKTASVAKKQTQFLRKSVVRAFSEAAMIAMQPLHKDVFVKGACFFPENETCESILSTQDGDLVRLAFDQNMFLSDIIPCEKVLSECGVGKYSETFFRKYWEPIVDSVGHFHSRGNSLVAVVNLDKSKRDLIKAFNIKEKTISAMKISRPVVLGKKTWLLSKTSFKVVDSPKTGINVNDEIECVNSKLPSYFGRTGVVDAINAKTDKVLYRVDFRRGLGIVWLEDESVKKVNLGI